MSGSPTLFARLTPIKAISAILGHPDREMDTKRVALASSEAGFREGGLWVELVVQLPRRHPALPSSSGTRPRSGVSRVSATLLEPSHSEALGYDLHDLRLIFIDDEVDVIVECKAGCLAHSPR